MTAAGQACLLVAMISAGYSTFTALAGGRGGSRRTSAAASGSFRGAIFAALTSLVALTAVTVILAIALVTKDFGFAYVAQYSDPLLPWHFSLSALWVGQAGSLLLWAWFVALLAIAYWVQNALHSLPEAGRNSQAAADGQNSIGRLAFGLQMAYLAFLVAIMVFAADPAAPSLVPGMRGEGLSPLLQHPAMLIHPPIVFLSFAAWGVPFAIAAAALIRGQLDSAWCQQARPWALFAWTTLGGGILLGGEWAYEQLGWGGYWAWDPVENGSLMPWLTGTALIHGLLTWRQGSLKKTTLALAIVTFALCNFSTFLTRSGIFSSLHAFSRSPIGWMFLTWIAACVVGGTALIVFRRKQLAADRPLQSLLSRETLALSGIVALAILTTVTLLGTLTGALSGLYSSKPIVVGMAFYNYALIPSGLILLAIVAAVPLVRWGAGPVRERGRWILLSSGTGLLAAIVAIVIGVRNPVGLAVTALVASLTATTIVAVGLDVAGARESGVGSISSYALRFVTILRLRRRSYGGYLAHLGFACMAVGIAGSSLGSRETQVSMTHGETVQWAGRTIHFAELVDRDLVQQRIVAANLEIQEADGRSYSLSPTQNFYRPQNQWGSKVAIQSSFAGDFYILLHSGSNSSKIHLTFMDHPLIRWIWLGGWVGLTGVLLAIWPQRQRQPARPASTAPHAVIPAPHLAAFRRASAKRDRNRKSDREL